MEKDEDSTASPTFRKYLLCLREWTFRITGPLEESMEDTGRKQGGTWRQEALWAVLVTLVTEKTSEQVPGILGRQTAGSH